VKTPGCKMYIYCSGGDVAHWRQELVGALPPAGTAKVPPLPEGSKPQCTKEPGEWLSSLHLAGLPGLDTRHKAEGRHQDAKDPKDVIRLRERDGSQNFCFPRVRGVSLP